MLRIVSMLCCLMLPATALAAKVALLSTSFVLERKFQLMESAARSQGVDLAWTLVDRDGEAGVARALAGAALVIIDAPRTDDQATIERMAGEALRKSALPMLSIQVMTPGQRLKPARIDGVHAQRLFEYYVSGTRINHERMAQYLRALAGGGDTSRVPPPVELPNGGIYHPHHEHGVFDNLPDYLAWWSRRSGQPALTRPVIGVEIASSYLSDGQTRMLDETVAALERAGALPLVFYRASRASRETPPRRTAGAGSTSSAPTAAEAPARPGTPAPVITGMPLADHDGFPNPRPAMRTAIDEPLLTLDGRIILNVLLVNTFIGAGPDVRKALHQAMGIPVIYVTHYRTGTRADYYRDRAGISSFSLPNTLTVGEYIGLQDPLILAANEGGELVPIPEQMDLLVGKAVNLARLQTKPNADKRVALLFWNHPPGERNQGASNLNVPRSIEHLVERLRAEGYAFDAVTEEQLISAVAQMLRPAYRHGGLDELMRTPHWDFLPLAAYRRWYATLPDAVRSDVEKHWGAPDKSAWIARKEGVAGFVIPRLRLGNLVVMPQPSRGEMAHAAEEKKLFHDTKQPLNHVYMAAYLWIREHFKADAIVHFGTHGTQEWTPGKERGLWAYDSPNILVANIPVVYPYIVDNIGEAIHVKRRGRGVIVSHQTPAFSPAGLSDDFVKINALIREYHGLDQGLVRDNTRKSIIEQMVRLNIHRDLKWKVADLERDFDGFLRDVEDYLEDLGAAQQPLGLHTLGRDAQRTHQVSNVMQMLGPSLYAALGIENARALLRADYRKLQESLPYRFVDEVVFSARPLDEISDPKLRRVVERGRKFLADLRANGEIEGIVKGLSARWIDPSYGGDPIRNPDALPTGRNIYGFDPSRVPTRAAYEAGKEALEQLIARHRQAHGKFPDKLAFTLWSTETMRHLGMLEAQIYYAMGVKPKWDEGGRVIGLEVIPLKELGRPRIDPVISITGLYRDQFPNVMERINEAVTLLAALDEPDGMNAIRANTARIKARLVAQGIQPQRAEEFALTRVFGNESGDYGTRLPQASLASDRWNEGDGKLEQLYLSRMSWAYGPDSANWSRKLTDDAGREINAYAEHLKGVSAVVFSRSSNLRGLLDTDHPFEYLGGISLAVKYLDGANPQLYISNLRDPQKARLETAEAFLAKELRAVYQHPNWMKEMQKEGYAGTLQMLNAINNFWGWQVMDRNMVRDDQWQEFHDSYVKDRYRLGLRQWFEKSNPTALAQIAERMLEAIRKDYWRADDQTKRELVRVYRDIALRHDVHTDNETFKAYVAELAAGFGLDAPGAVSTARAARIGARAAPQPLPATQPPPAPEVVRGQHMHETPYPAMVEKVLWSYAGIIAAVILLGIGYQAWRTQRERIIDSRTSQTLP